MIPRGDVTRFRETGETRNVLAEGDGQENRRLGAFSFRFLNRRGEKPADCAQECAQTCVPKASITRRYKLLSWLHLTSEATAWTAVAFTASLSKFPCKCLGHVYLQVRGEVAERLKAAVC